MSNFFIPKPCHENWDKMTPQEQGRHCDVCSKVVVDFTKKSDPEINALMAEAPGKVCGHFHIGQLNQSAQQKVFNNPLNLFGRNWKYFAMSVFGFFAFNKKADAQVKGKVAIRGDIAPVQTHDTNTEVTTLYGTVFTTNGKPAGNAVLKIYSGGNVIATTTTNANGTYSVKLYPGKITGKKIDIDVSHTYGASKYVPEMSISQEKTKLNITLDEMMMLKGEVQYIEPPVVDTSSIKVEPVAGPKDTVIMTCKLAEPVSQQDDTFVRKHSMLSTNIVVKEETNVPVTEEKKEMATVVPATTNKSEVISTIFPNPSGTYATVYCNRSTMYKVELYDEKGALKMPKAFNGDRTDLDVSALARGNYFVNVRDDAGNSNTLKLVKL